jgi:hypothetical protein
MKKKDIKSFTDILEAAEKILAARKRPRTEEELKTVPMDVDGVVFPLGGGKK